MPLLRVEIKRLYVMYCTSHSFFFQRRRGERKSARCVDAAAFIEIDLTSASDIDLYDEQLAPALYCKFCPAAPTSVRGKWSCH